MKARADVEGYDEASDAIEAVQRMAKENYDVMLLDISGRLGPDSTQLILDTSGDFALLRREWDERDEAARSTHSDKFSRGDC